MGSRTEGTDGEDIGFGETLPQGNGGADGSGKEAQPGLPFKPRPRLPRLRREDDEEGKVANAGGDFDAGGGPDEDKDGPAKSRRPREGRFTGRTQGTLRLISIIAVAMKKSNFLPDGTRSFTNAVERLCGYLSLNETQVILFASLFTFYYDSGERPVAFMGIADFYSCNPLAVLQYQPEIPAILERGILEEVESEDSNVTRPYYKVPQFVTDAILADRPIPPADEHRVRTVQTFLRQVERAGDVRVDSSQKIQTLYSIVEAKERSHKNVATLANVKKLLPDVADRTILYDIAAGMVNHINTEVDLMVLINRSTDESSARQAVLEQFMGETHVLFALELVQFENKASMMDSTVSLTDKAFGLLLGEEGKFYQKKLGDKQLRRPDKIQEKELFYMEENAREVEKLTAALDDENLRRLQSRLEERKLPRGICALFYGEPGTGKTETVYQMARKTNRPVMHVDIGSMRSQWYGETEQKFSKLFNDYRKMCESAEKGGEPAPILLFNEADAIFGRRIEISSQGGGGRVDNTIQNILLEEMERLRGILVATTNLEGNLDGAFERRFLFKVKFQKPDSEVKAKIWRSNLGWLTEEQARLLAREFPFSGGEITNIVRKVALDEILGGSVPPFEDVLSYCRSEKIRSGRADVGFRTK